MSKWRKVFTLIAVLGVLALSLNFVLSGQKAMNVTMMKANSGLDGGGYVASGTGNVAAMAATPATTGEATSRNYGALSLGTAKPAAIPETGSSDNSAPAFSATDGRDTGGIGSSDGSTTSGDDGTMAYTERKEVAPAQPSTYYPPAPDQDPLKAAETDDNANYAAFISYLNNYVGPHNAAPDLSERLIVQVVDGQQLPVADAEVMIAANGQTLYTARSTSDGRIVFFPRAVNGATGVQSYDISVRRDGQTAQAKLVRGSEANGPLTVSLNVKQAAASLDVVFLIDSTGSMGDEIAKVKATIHNIAGRIGQLPGQPSLRLGLVTYRDRGDNYLTRKWDFTTDVNTFAAQLDTLQAIGGGDYPEDVQAGLQDALNLDWAQQNNPSLRLVFLVGDAPVRLDYSDEPGYASLSAKAAAQGIKLFPIAASGLNDEGEFIFRQMAAMTLGKFVFLTYAATPDGQPGNGGASGDTTTMNVSGYQTNNLDDVVVRLISAEVANQSKQALVQTGNAAPITFREPSLPSRPAQSSNNPFIWLLASACLPVAAVGIIVIHRRRSLARRAPIHTRSAHHEETAKDEVKALATAYSYIRPANHWATSISDAPTSRLGQG